MKKQLKLLVVLTILLMPFVVKATEIKEITNDEPEYREVKSDKFFIANGTPIVISEVGGETVVTWGENGRQVIPNDTVVIGGTLNPCTTGELCNIYFKSTNITMTGGTVKSLVGGSELRTQHSLYLSAKVGTVNINITGGNVTTAVFGLVTGSVAVPTALLSTLGENYVATNVKINVDGGNLARIIGTSSYTHIGTLEVNVKNATITNDSAGINGSTNGYVENAIFTVEDSNVSIITAGFRAMVDNYKVIVKGNTTVGDIFAGNYYPETEMSAVWTANGGLGIGQVSYGEAEKIEITVEDGVKYNNIYPGFQFLEKEKFYEYYKSNTLVVNKIVQGIDGSEYAPVILNIGATPLVLDSGLESLINSTRTNVTTNIIKKAELPVIDTTKPVEKPVFGVADTEKVDEVLQETINKNETVKAAIAAGKEVNVTLEVKEETIPDAEKAKVEELVKGGIILGYFDINVLLKIDGTDDTKIEELSKPIELSIVLPETIEKVEEGFARTYYLVREHDGEYELIEAKLGADGKTISFVTDKFSNYTLTYVDNKVEKNPQTSDSILLVVGIATVSIIGLGTCLVYKKKH